MLNIRNVRSRPSRSRSRRPHSASNPQEVDSPLVARWAMNRTRDVHVTVLLHSRQLTRDDVSDIGDVVHAAVRTQAPMFVLVFNTWTGILAGDIKDADAIAGLAKRPNTDPAGAVARVILSEHPSWKYRVHGGSRRLSQLLDALITTGPSEPPVSVCTSCPRIFDCAGASGLQPLGEYLRFYQYGETNLWNCLSQHPWTAEGHELDTGAKVLLPRAKRVYWNEIRIGAWNAEFHAKPYLRVPEHKRIRQQAAAAFAEACRCGAPRKCLQCRNNRLARQWSIWLFDYLNSKPADPNDVVPQLLTDSSFWIGAGEQLHLVCQPEHGVAWIIGAPATYTTNPYTVERSKARAVTLLATAISGPDFVQIEELLGRRLKQEGTRLLYVDWRPHYAVLLALWMAINGHPSVASLMARNIGLDASDWKSLAALL